MPGNTERQQQILDAAAAVIIRLGYDQATITVNICNMPRPGWSR